MSQNQSLQQANAISMCQCLHVDKTFPKLPMKLRKAGSDNNRQIVYQTTMKQYEKKFFEDEIRLLLSKYKKISIKANKQECEIERMKKKMERMNHDKRSFSQDQIKKPGAHFHHEQDTFSENTPTEILAAKRKTGQNLKICETKNEYENKLLQKQKEYEQKVKQIKFEHMCKIIKLKKQMESFLKQKKFLQFEFKQLKSTQLGNLNGANISEVIQIQNLKEENALLRSFIYKVQIVQNQIQQIEQSRIKERMEFAQFARQVQIQKRKLDEELHLEKSHFEEKVKRLENDFAEKMHEKGEKLNWLQQENEKLKIQSELIKSHAKQNIRQQLGESILQQAEIIKKNQIQLKFNVENSLAQLQRSEAKLHLINSTKQQQIAKLRAEVQEIKNKQSKYYRQIERLRIERNRLALQNAELEQKINILRQEMKNICEEQQKNISDFIINDGITQVQQFNLSEINQVKNKIKHLQQQIQLQKDNHIKLQQKFTAFELYYKGRESSLKLGKEMAQNSYKQIWHKQKEISEMLSVEISKRSCLQRQIDDLQIKLLQSQQQVSSFREEQQKQKSLLRVQLSTIRQKHENIKKQYEQILTQKNNKHEELELKIFRLSKQLQDTKQNNKQQQRQEQKRMQKEIKSKSEQINRLQQQIKNLQQQYENQQNEEIAQLKDKMNLESKKVQLLEQNVISTRNSFNQIIQQKSSIISFLKSQADQKQFKAKLQTKQKPNLEQYSKVSQSRFEKQKNTISHIYQYLIEQESIEEQSKIQQYQQQISHINSNHQEEVDHLKSYIYDLLDDNDKLKENCMVANNLWNRMYGEVQRYNKFLVEGQSQVECSTIRKREIELKLGKNKRQNQQFSKISKLNRVVENTQKRNETIGPLCELEMVKGEEIFSREDINSLNKFQVISVPSFSQSKLGEMALQKQVASDMRRKERSNRNICKQIEDQLKASMNGKNSEQQNLNVSNLDLKQITGNTFKLKNKKNEPHC